MKEGSNEAQARAVGTTIVCALDLVAPEYDFAFSTLQIMLGEARIVRADLLGKTEIVVGAQDHMVVFLRLPEVSLALALASTGDPVQALDAWVTAREMLVARFRKARRQVTLIDIELFERRDERVWGALCRRLGIEAESEASIAELGALRGTLPIHDVAARMLIQFDPRAHAVVEELTLAMLGPGLPPFGVSAVATLLGEWKALSSLRLDLTALNNLQSLAHDALLSESKQLHKEVSRLQEILSEAERARDQAQASVAVLTSERDRIGAEAAALGKQRDEACAELDSNRAELEAEKIARNELATELKSARAALEAVRSELVLLRDSDALQKTVSQQLAETEAEHKKTIRDLRMQLGDHLLTLATQDALQRRLDAQTEAERRMRGLLGAQLLADARIAVELTSVKAILAETKEQLAAVSLMLDDTTRNSEVLKMELARVLSSKSWRLTSPLRVALRQISR